MTRTFTYLCLLAYCAAAWYYAAVLFAALWNCTVSRLTGTSDCDIVRGLVAVYLLVEVILHLWLRRVK